ncbi:MAG: hypothetical protein GEV04_05720 [Actinophytocola sp.]|nr:hypothetical protein [Actinophytocola sp.]
MFPVYCPRHGSTVLLGLSHMRRMINVKPGVILLEFTCYDGEVVRLLTGSGVPGEVTLPPRSPDDQGACGATHGG